MSVEERLYGAATEAARKVVLEYGGGGSTLRPATAAQLSTLARACVDAALAEASSPEGRAWLARLAFPPEQLKGLLDMDSVSVRHLNAAYEVLSAALGSASGEDR